MWFTLPIVFASITTVIVAMTVCCLSVDKLVRIIFPFIKKKGNYNVAFGFILKKWQIFSHYIKILVITLYTVMIFFDALLVKTSYKYNPYDEFDCYFGNESKVETNPEEALSLEVDVMCYAWNFNIGGAAGQATGTLALSWIAVSVVIWIALKFGYLLKIWNEDNSKNNKKSTVKKCHNCLIVIAQISIYIGTGGMLTIAVISAANDWVPYSRYSFLEIMLFAIILLTAAFYCSDVTKEPKSLKNSCKEVVKVNIEEPWEAFMNGMEILTKISKQDLIELNAKCPRKSGRREERWTRSEGERRRLLADEMQYNIERADLQKQMKNCEEEEKIVISEIKELWKEKLQIEEERFKLKKEKLELDIKNLKRKEFIINKKQGLDVIEEDIMDESSLQRELCRFEESITTLNEREIACEKENRRLTVDRANKIIKDQVAFLQNKNRLRKKRRSLKQNSDDIKLEKEKIELENEGFKIEEEKAKLIRINILREMAKLECKMALASEAAFYITEEEMKKITEAAFYEIILSQSETLPQTTTDTAIEPALFYKTLHKYRHFRYWEKARTST